MPYVSPHPQPTVLNGNDPPPNSPHPPSNPRTHMPQAPASCSAVASKTCSTSSLLLLSLTALVALGARIRTARSLVNRLHPRAPARQHCVDQSACANNKKRTQTVRVRRHPHALTRACTHRRRPDPSSQERSRHRGANARFTHNACIRRASEPFRQCVTQRHLHDPRKHCVLY